MKERKEFDYFDRPENIRRLWIFLYLVCALTLVPDIFTGREGHFGFDRMFGFYALLGFISCAALIIASKLLGLVLKAKEGYYND